ncbi:MAG: amino acid permease, partial [Polyangiales bacterium]
MSSAKKAGQRRHLDLIQATGVGVGAIVGGGILVLAGAAFRETGPSALLAFALNGIIAIMTALSFAEMSSMFPESGGAYTFAKKVLTVRAAFVVGWVLWFAYIVAGVLYALGFAEYAVLAASDLLVAAGPEAPAWLHGRPALSGLAVLATGAYSLLLIRSNKGGGQIETVGKLVI